jgi:cellobiose-specific phosphotransferase system component IIC
MVPTVALCYSLLFWSLGTHGLIVTASITCTDLLQVLDYNIQAASSHMFLSLGVRAFSITKFYEGWWCV